MLINTERLHLVALFHEDHLDLEFFSDNVTHEIVNNDTSVPDFKMRTSFLRCRVWESDKEKWAKDICKVIYRSNYINNNVYKNGILTSYCCTNMVIVQQHFLST